MISVCLASYNGEKYIKEQINSILAQLCDQDELIISDDGSDDRTLEIIQEFGDLRIKMFQNNGIHGYTHNFENALIHASGDYIFFSDQDDVWLPGKINKMLPYLKDDVLVFSDAFITNENLEVLGKISDWRKYKKGYIRNLYKNIYTGCTCAFTKKIKDYTLPFPVTKFIMHDNWIGLLCELKFKVVYLDEALIWHRRHNDNTSSMTNKSNRTIMFMFKYRFLLLVKTLQKAYC
ncbi:MAG TPA: glycosyltransferase family 2 protein [Paludibacter sp.]|nr:glycosyltransferase family 2 protein [Paludibacter sp.]